MVQTVKENFRKKLLLNNEWIDGDNEYGLILTDDLDSLLSCAILKSVKGWNVEQCMIFKGNLNRVKNGNDSCLYDYYGETENATHEAIGVDLALVNGKCFDNHLTAFNYDCKINQESINLNRICNKNRNCYGQKYNLSTVLLLWSLYDLPKDNLSDELMMLLIAIDGSFEGYYNDYFNQHNRRYMVEILDLPKFYECQQRHTYNEFKAIQRKYNIHKGHGKIKLSKGYLSTDIDIDAVNELLSWDTDIQLELPTERFYKKAIFQDIAMEIKGYPSSIDTICDNPFCYALTKKNFVNYSKRIEF